MTTIRVKQLFTHPVKGLTPQLSTRVDLLAGHGIPGDRAFALMYDTADAQTTDPIVPWKNKKSFAMQCDRPELAALACEYEASTGILTVRREDAELLMAEANTAIGRTQISQFFSHYLTTVSDQKIEPRPLRLVGTGEGTTRYPDRNHVHLSLISTATLENLSQLTGQFVDSRRFRPNIVVEGVSAWEELNWVGREFNIGTARIAIEARLPRCLNIDVDPDTGVRDLPLFSLLQQAFHHRDTGVLATVIQDGSVTLGDSLL
ncbi:MOSC domain-containing protein [Phormidesmis sp. 146-33]